MTHTPGPWNYWRKDDETIITGANEAFVAQPDGSTADEHIANARLIAAAPELLEALIGLHAFACTYQGKMSDRQRDLLEQTRAAIAKAEGR